jgi:hypothetical protein
MQGTRWGCAKVTGGEHLRGNERTAIEHPLVDERCTNPSKAGMEEMLTPTSSSASVTLKSVASNVLWAVTAAASAPTTERADSLIVGINEYGKGKRWAETKVST